MENSTEAPKSEAVSPRPFSPPATGRFGASLDWLARVLTYIYLLRFPFLTAVGMVGIALVAAGPANPLLGNLFHIPQPRGIFYLSFSAFFTAWVIMAAGRLILINSLNRFSIDPKFFPKYRSLDLRKRVFGACGLVAVPMVAYAICRTAAMGDRSVGIMLIEAAAGVLVATLVMLLLALFHNAPLLFTTYRQLRKHRSEKTKIDQAYDIFFPLGVATGYRVDGQEVRLSSDSRVGRFFARIFFFVPESIGGGMLRYGNDGKPESVENGQLASIAMAFVILVFYALVGYKGFLRIDAPPSFPTLGYLLLLMMTLCWLLSGMSYFFDRFRIPVLIPLVAWMAFTTWFSSDYYFHVEEDVRVEPPKVVSTGMPADDATVGSRIVVVAANGGGIQAAAWTARVLTGLQREIGDEFARSVRLISAVSGGSVGTMYYVNEYDDRGPPDKCSLDDIVRRAEESSLDKLAWGLVYPDFTRIAISNSFGWGRGEALERSFLRKHLTWNQRHNVLVPLTTWKQDAAQRKRPAVIFNTTVVETGKRLALSTMSSEEEGEGTESMTRFYKENLGSRKDLRVVTAVRLSAAFPFVSPAARPRDALKPVHLVDGGYYDNYGTAALVGWLDRTLAAKGSKVKHVLLVRIHGAPTSEKAPVGEGNDNGAHSEDSGKRGWFYQISAPLRTLLAVRTAGQLSHADLEIDLLQKKWGGDRVLPDKKVTIDSAVFEFCRNNDDDYCREDPPLSWHLNPKEKLAIEKSWEKDLKGRDGSGMATVKNFFPARSSLDVSGCPAATSVQ